MKRLGFEISSASDSVRLVTPTVDGVSLVTLVAQYERSKLYDPSGGYGGLVLDASGFHPVARYFSGAIEDEWTALLACDCGEVGCWPLECRIEMDGHVLRWATFRQPHRAIAWDYSGFGPFVFERTAYEAALNTLSEAFPAPRW